MDIRFDGLSVAELTTIKTAILTAVASASSGIQSYSIQSRSVTRTSLRDLLDDLAAVTNEIARRSVASDQFGLGVVEFGRP